MIVHALNGFLVVRARIISQLDLQQGALLLMDQHPESSPQQLEAFSPLRSRSCKTGGEARGDFVELLLDLQCNESGDPGKRLGARGPQKCSWYPTLLSLSSPKALGAAAQWPGARGEEADPGMRCNAPRCN